MMRVLAAETLWLVADWLDSARDGLLRAAGWLIDESLD